MHPRQQVPYQLEDEANEKTKEKDAELSPALPSRNTFIHAFHIEDLK